jgi:hypothetical protein
MDTLHFSINFLQLLSADGNLHFPATESGHSMTQQDKTLL